MVQNLTNQGAYETVVNFMSCPHGFSPVINSLGRLETTMHGPGAKSALYRSCHRLRMVFTFLRGCETNKEDFAAKEIRSLWPEIFLLIVPA